MKKWLIILIMVLCVAPIATATICEDVTIPGTSCNVTTPPVIGCSIYNYTIINESNASITGNLTLIAADIYYFTFNESEGGYTIKLCDGTSTQIIVKESENMTVALIIGIGIVTAFFLILGLSLDKDHFLLKLMLLFFASISLFYIGSVFLIGVEATAKKFINIPYAFFTLFVIYIFIYIFYYYFGEKHGKMKFIGEILGRK